MKPPDRPRATPRRVSSAGRACVALAWFGLAGGCEAYNHGAYAVLVDGATRATDVAVHDAPAPDVAPMDVAPRDADAPDVLVADVTDARDALSPDAHDAAPPACHAAAVADYCPHLPMLPAAPVLDGVLDCGLVLQTIPATAVTDAIHASVQFAAAWRPDGVYVYVVVHESTRNPVAPGTASNQYYCGDAVEVFVDTTGVFPLGGGYNPSGTAQLIITAPADDATPSTRVSQRTGTAGPAATARAVVSSTFAAYPRAGGYVVEAFVAAHELGVASWTVAADHPIGLDLAVDFSEPETDGGYVCGGGVDYAGQLVWHYQMLPCSGGPCHPSSNGQAFCTPNTDAP